MEHAPPPGTVEHPPAERVPILPGTILLDTVHGSHLYGLAHAGSDRDRYVVLANRPSGHHRARWARQSISRATGVGPDSAASDDVMTTDLATFLSMCDAGVPQALEAMFSTMTTTDRIGPLRAAYRAGVYTTAVTYHRTIVSFVHSPEVKRRRHALRLAVNLSQLMSTSRFTPALDPDLILALTEEARTLESAWPPWPSAARWKSPRPRSPTRPHWAQAPT